MPEKLGFTRADLAAALKIAELIAATDGDDLYARLLHDLEFAKQIATIIADERKGARRR